MKQKDIFPALKSAGCVVLITVFINSYTPPATTFEVQARPDTIFALIPKPSEVVLLARLVESEARSEAFKGKLLVAETVANRMADKGRSLKDVVYRKGQFDGIRTRVFNERPSCESVAAAVFSLLGSDLLPDDVLYYHNPVTSTDTAWVRYIEKYKVLQEGRHVFCSKPK